MERKVSLVLPDNSLSQEGRGILFSETPTPLQPQVNLVSNFDAYIREHRSGDREVLRSRQFDIFTDIRDFINAGGTRGYVEAPAGFGKTVVFSQVAQAANTRTTIVVPTKPLVEQTYNRMRQFAPDISVSRFYSDAYDPLQQVDITTYKSFAGHNYHYRQRHPELVILDEAHESTTAIRQAALARYNEQTTIIGFTATPDYSRNIQVNTILPELIHQISIEEAVREGYLSPFSIVIALTQTDLTSVKVSAAGEYEISDLDRAINYHGRNQAAVDVYRKFAALNPKSAKALVNCSTVNHAQRVAELFNLNGIPAATVFGEQEVKVNLKLIKMLESGDLQVLTNAQLLTRGIDIPSLTVCLNLSPTASPGRARQRTRNLRLDPNNPDKHALIIDFLDLTDTASKQPVTFDQVVGKIEVSPPTKTSNELFVRPNRHPWSNLSDIKIEVEGLKVITSETELARVNRDRIIETTKTAPEGWMDMAGTANFLKLSDYQTRNRVNSLGKTHPDWVKFYPNQLGRQAIFVSPEGLEKLRSDLETQTPPEDWLTRTDIAIKLTGSTKSTTAWTKITVACDDLKFSNPELCFLFERSGVPYEYFHPTILGILASQIGQAEQDAERIEKSNFPPEGWKTVNDWALTLGTSYVSVTYRLNYLKRHHPDLFGAFQSRTGKNVYEYFSPAMISLFETVPTKQSSTNKRILKKVDRVFQNQVPSEKHLPEDTPINETTTEPSIQDLLEHEGEFDFQTTPVEVEYAPTGWKKLEEIAEYLNVNRFTLNYKLKRVEESEPEKAKKFFSPETGRTEVYFSPDVVIMLAMA